MGINTLIEQFQNTLVQAVNECQLPIGVAYLVAKDVFSQLENGYQKALTQEKEMQEKQEEEKEEVE